MQPGDLAHQRETEACAFAVAAKAIERQEDVLALFGVSNEPLLTVVPRSTADLLPKARRSPGPK